MEREVAFAMKQFFAAQKHLDELGVLHSEHYLEDVGRYLCQLAYGLEPGPDADRGVLDGRIGPSRVVIRITNSPRRQPMELREPLEFDELIVILGPNSGLRPPGVASDFIFYRFTPDEIRQRFDARRERLISRPDTFDRRFDRGMNMTSG